MSFIREKLSSDLINMVSEDENNIFPVIIQVNGNLIEEDEKIIFEAGGTIKSKLAIINSYATELSVKSIKDLTRNGRIKKIYYDGEVHAI
ncbi:MAG TPA: hypothetical protein PL110_20615 [Candidatus Eremiobacteraeota bacterium]|nr:MAG: hypothetical protein BWY64_02895 [bacterium ADurb.Bin363]HPZ10505.1 hypothetical protein [Candidatus Eremiobacteraeota bacterium]